MSTGLLKALVAVTVVTCVVVIVVWPFVDLPLTVQNDRVHFTTQMVETALVLGPFLLMLISIFFPRGLRSVNVTQVLVMCPIRRC
ncbi:MAG TPA: hypothetical protein VKW78_16830 [Terriglobales bacterium]|jgi:hypothetical protein|nr:hypothetical protein [Terriglobales bacterium]